MHVITTIDPRLQKAAIEALRNGLENYDKRHGWRGPIENIKINNLEKDFIKVQNKFSDYSGLHKKEIGLVTEVKNNEITIVLLKEKTEISIDNKKIKEAKWINNGITKHDLDNLNTMFKNDIIVLNPKDGISNDFNLDQIPEVNGAIVAVDPRNGRVLALSGGYDFDNSEFNRQLRPKATTGVCF